MNSAIVVLAPRRSGAADGAGKLAHACVHFLGQREDPLRVAEHELAGGSERDAAVVPLEKPGVEMLFELLYLERDRRLRHEKLFRGLGEAQLLRDRVEDLQTPVSHAFRSMNLMAAQSGRSGRRGRAHRERTVIMV